MTFQSPPTPETVEKGGVTADIWLRLVATGVIGRDDGFCVRMDEAGEVTIRPRTVKMWEIEYKDDDRQKGD